MLVTYKKHRLWLAAASALSDSVKEEQSGDVIPANTPCLDEELKTKIRELLTWEADMVDTLLWKWLETQLPDLRAHVSKQQLRLCLCSLRAARLAANQ